MTETGVSPLISLGVALGLGVLIVSAAFHFQSYRGPLKATPSSFPRRALSKRLRSGGVVPEHVFQLALTAGEQIYSLPRPPLPPLLQQAAPDGALTPARKEWDALADKWEGLDDHIFEAIARSLSAYLAKLPRFDPAPFSKPLTPSGSLLYDMFQPFREPHMQELGLGRSLVDRFNANVGTYTDSVKGAMEPLYPQRFQGRPEDMASTYLKGTPFLPLFNVLVPFNPFTDEQRFTHHWCLGHNGTGKTTYLRHLIKHDLERATRGECSVVVIDSKKLIREMRTLAVLRDVDLTLIDADVPFPLNPFKLPRPQAVSLIRYMLANLTDASPLQTGALTFLAEAAHQSSHPSLKTMRDFFELKVVKGEMELPEDFLDFDADTQKWFKNTFKGLHSATREGLHQRLANFIKEYPLLAGMFEADSFGLDYKDLHTGGAVWLIDTNRAKFGKDGANIFGRLIIALIDQLSNYRTDHDEKSLKPVFVYMDEAQDYIERDAIFADILEKARAQQVGMTVAHHFKGQVDTRAEQSLENAGIKSECLDIGTVQVRTRREQFALPVKKLEFEQEPQLTRDEYKLMRAKLAHDSPSKSSLPAGVVEPADYK